MKKITHITIGLAAAREKFQHPLHPRRSSRAEIIGHRTYICGLGGAMRLAFVSTLFLMATLVAARADTVAFVGSSTGAFGTIDLNNGVFTSIGQFESTNNIPQSVDGLAVLNGSMFASEATNGTAHGTLFTVNPTNGVLTAVGPDTGLYYLSFGSTTSGLFAVGFDPNSASRPWNLYSLNPSTGAATLIGPTGLGSGTGFIRGALSTNSGALFFADDNNGEMYTLNTSTGSPTLLGAFGGNTTIGALLLEDGTLYGGDNFHNTLDNINPATGAAGIGPVSGVFQADQGYIYALAPSVTTPPASTPEPATWSMICAGAMIVLVRARWVWRSNGITASRKIPSAAF